VTWHQDDWPKWRRGGAHLTDEELLFIRRSKRAGYKIKDVAKALSCSSRTVELHYGKMGDWRRGRQRRPHVYNVGNPAKVKGSPSPTLGTPS
jgi:transposase